MRELSRRNFLARAAAVMAAPIALSACSRRSGSRSETSKPQADVEPDLDEVIDAASFRPPLPQVEPTIRVRVLRAHSTSAAVKIGEEHQWLRVGDVAAPERALALHGPVTVSMESAGWAIVDGKGFRASIASRSINESEDSTSESLRAPTLVVAPAADEFNRLLNVNDITPRETSSERQYGGELRLVPRPDLDRAAARKPNAFDVINHLPLEEYLPGVLIGELFRSWQLHTFAAQAVAARSFACTELAVFAGRRHYDVTNTASSQMYVGTVRDSKAHEAVAMTRGMVLAYDNLLVSGYYSSCCGGTAASAPDVIGSNPVNDVAPLHGRAEPDVCTDAPVYQWRVEYPIDLLTRRLIAYGKERRIKDLANFTRIEAIEIIETNPHGRPKRFRLIDQPNSGVPAVELTAENFRRAANYSGQGLHPPDKPLRSSNVRAIFTRDTVALEGFGFGHGVGLCQYGTETLARSGKTFDEIIRWYYPGVEIVAAYT